jgi:hypothetical protein
MRARHLDRLLLLAAGAALFFGGGLGCDPVLQGVDFRATSRLSVPDDRTSPRDWYMAFNGKKAPGNGSAQLPYELTPPFGVSARMGVFVEESLAASLGAEGCIGLRDTESSDEHRLCVTYQTGPANLRIAFGAATADCPGATRAALDLDDDGVNVTARYKCGGIGSFVTLDTIPSLWAEGEAWNAFVGAAGVAKGGQVAFDDFLVASEDPSAMPGSPADVAFESFEAWRLGVEAVYEIEDENLAEAGALAGIAQGKLGFAAATTSDPDAGKLLGKAESSIGKLLLDSAKYQKGFVKVANVIASALETLDATF